jgi:hypothetical protein
MAARVHILKESVANPEAEFDRVNTQGTINLVKQCTEAGVKHFIFLSSIGKAMGESPLLLPFPPSLLKLGTKIIGKGDVGDRLLGSLQVDISKIRQMLNWKPPYHIDYNKTNYRGRKTW